jgi:hypothetical protein
MNKPKTVIVDIDGTIAKHVNRDVYDYDKVLNDVPRPNVIRWIKDCISDDITITYLTGRDDSCWDDTVRWLSDNVNHHFSPNSKNLIMRHTGDTRPSPITKRELYEQYVEPHYDVVFAIDDMKKNADMWKFQCGIRSFLVQHEDEVGTERIVEII